MNNFKLITTVGVLVILVLPVSIMPVSTVKLPGSIQNISSYIDSFSAAKNNLIYYLSETMLFEQIPNFKEIMNTYLQSVRRNQNNQKQSPRISLRYHHKRGRLMYKNKCLMMLTHRIKVIISKQRALKEYLGKITGNLPGKISLDLKHPQEYAVARVVFKIIGLVLEKDSNHRYRLLELPSSPYFEPNHFYRILGLNIWSVERVLNKTHRFELQLKEFEAVIPWELDFLREITGLELTPDSFVEILTLDQRFQLLVGLLYRLSDREIDYINLLKPNLSAWKEIYKNDQLLCGMFVLSHALRVKNGELHLPGSPDPNAAPFWNRLTGSDYHQRPFEFLEQLALKDQGKLNYFYTFTFFLPEDTQKAILGNFNYQKFREIYQLVKLNKTGKIRGIQLPGLEDFGFFTLVYALKTRNGEIEFPGGIQAWAEAVGTKNKTSAFALLKQLLTESNKHSLERFIPVYCKLFHRREILTPEVIRTLYENYLEYNVLVDFIEKIPVKEPQTVLKMFSWAKSFKNLHLAKKERKTLIAVFQSLLEILAQKAKYAPHRYQYDQLIQQLIQIPLSEKSVYDDVFRFFARDLDIDLSPSGVEQSFWEFLLPADPEVVIHNQRYRLETSVLLKKEILRILEKQSAANLSRLVQINGLLKYIGSSSWSQGYEEIRKQLIAAFQQLPLPDEEYEVNTDLPANLRRMEEIYSTAKLYNNLSQLVEKKKNKAPQQEITALIQQVKTDCLLQELKNFLLTTIYAVSVKDSRLPIFLNPNLTRHHDFSFSGGKTPWNHSAISQNRGYDRGYHLEGGLSRLNITLAFPYSEQIFGGEMDFEPGQGVPIIVNIQDLFSYPLMQQGQEYTGLLVKFSEELLEKARENPDIREAIRNKLMKMTAGYRYRAIMQELAKPEPKGEFGSSLLYFSELLSLGEAFFIESGKKHKQELITHFSQKQQLDTFREPSLFQAVREETNQLGPIYYYTFGTLKPYRFPLFPPPLSLFFASRWTSAEMINELKVKSAYLSYLNKIPSQLLGCIAYQFLHQAAELFFHVSEINYHRTFYLHSVFNYLYLNQIYNTMRKSGVLRIK